METASVKSKNIMQLFLKILFGIAIFWTVLTVIVQMKNKKASQVMGASSATQSALIVYDSDPIYDLDKQVCNSFAKGLSEGDWHVHVQTVKAALDAPQSDYDLYVFCANTYNFAPDDAIVDYVDGLENLNGKQVIAITLGSGTTARAERIFEDIIIDKGALLLGSKAYWLMRPNDESRMEEDNAEVAVDMAYEFGKKIGDSLVQEEQQL